MQLIRGKTPEAQQGAFGIRYADASAEWYTPRSIFEALGLFFDLDPCSPVDGPLPWIPASRHLTQREDGLVQPWAGLVWLNPPYARGVPAWLYRLRRHGNGIALVAARPDSAWFQEVALASSAVCFVAGRIRFVNRSHEEAGCRRPSFASALVGFGYTAAQAIHRCGLGWVAK